MRKANQEFFSSAWWKKHKALTVKDKGLQAALVEYERAEKAIGATSFTPDQLDDLKETLKKVEKAAKATLDGIGKVGQVTAKTTVEHLEEYPARIKEELDRHKEWYAMVNKD